MVETNIKNVLKMKNDIIFKAFFSKKGNEKFLKSFLTAILGKELEIKRITHDARLEQLSERDKYGILDLDVELKSGEIVNIEIQLKDLHNIEKRTTYYAAKKIAEGISPKEDYNKLKKVIIIAILDYKFTELPEYFTKTVRVVDKHRDYELNNEVEYYYIELKKFREQNPNMKEPLNQWLAFLDMERGDLLEMAKKENKIIEEANKYYDVLTGEEEIKRLAEVAFRAQLEENTALNYAREEGKKERNKRTEKNAENYSGEKDKQIEIAKKMIKEKFDIETIAKLTGLTRKEIEMLQTNA